MENSIILLQHNHDKPIGSIVEASIDEDGLNVVGIVKVDEDNIYKKLKTGVIKTMSIGFSLLDYEIQETVKEDDSTDIVRVIKEIELYEISLVSVPMNPGAKVKDISGLSESEVKSVFQVEKQDTYPFHKSVSDLIDKIEAEKKENIIESEPLEAEQQEEAQNEPVKEEEIQEEVQSEEVQEENKEEQVEETEKSEESQETVEKVADTEVLEEEVVESTQAEEKEADKTTQEEIEEEVEQILAEEEESIEESKEETEIEESTEVKEEVEAVEEEEELEEIEELEEEEGEEEEKSTEDAEVKVDETQENNTIEEEQKEIAEDTEVKEVKMEQEEIDQVYDKYKETVNMSASELEAWSKTACSELASVDREPINRNLSLLRKNKSEWTESDAKEANRTISFVSRMKGNESGEDMIDEN